MKNIAPINHFYSENRTEDWLTVLGEKRHYHFGLSHGLQPKEDFMDHAVRALFPLIPEGSHIIDCGCGWGGPASLLIRERKCHVTGITASVAQQQFLAVHHPEIRAVCADLNNHESYRKSNIALFKESFTHIDNPGKMLSALSHHVDAIVMSDYFSCGHYFHNAEWNMHFRKADNIVHLLHEAGFTLKHFEDISQVDDIIRSARFWLEGISRLSPEKVTGHLQLLKNSANTWSQMESLGMWRLGIFYAVRKTVSAT